LEVFLSRVLFSRIFARQNDAFVRGQTWWVGHPCQKQPSTKMTVRKFLNTMSGLPGNVFEDPGLIPWSRNDLLSRISG
jgi:hypothetical protein